MRYEGIAEVGWFETAVDCTSTEMRGAASGFATGRHGTEAAQGRLSDAACLESVDRAWSAGRAAPLASMRSASLTTHPPLRGVRVVSDR
jgi:hypothetical protein